MNKAFEKILERLEERRKLHADLSISDKLSVEEQEIQSRICGCFSKSKQIVQEVAEEYKGGWIPCSERLPDDDSICIVTAEYPNNETVVDYGWFDRIGVCWYAGI